MRNVEIIQHWETEWPMGQYKSNVGIKLLETPIENASCWLFDKILLPATFCTSEWSTGADKSSYIQWPYLRHMLWVLLNMRQDKWWITWYLLHFIAICVGLPFSTWAVQTPRLHCSFGLRCQSGAQRLGEPDEDVVFCQWRRCCNLCFLGWEHRNMVFQWCGNDFSRGWVVMKTNRCN